MVHGDSTHARGCTPAHTLMLWPRGEPACPYPSTLRISTNSACGYSWSCASRRAGSTHAALCGVRVQHLRDRPALPGLFLCNRQRLGLWRKDREGDEWEPLGEGDCRALGTSRAKAGTLRQSELGAVLRARAQLEPGSRGGAVQVGGWKSSVGCAGLPRGRAGWCWGIVGVCERQPVPA